MLETLILARHAHAASNAGDTVNGIPPGEGLSPQGAEEAVALGAQLETEPIELGVSSRFRRASETLALALAGRGVPLVVEPGLDEIGFGSFEGGSLAAYRAWAWKHAPEAACPGGGETRADAARRIAAGLGALLDRPERVILAVTHGLPLRYVIDAADGSFPGPASRVRPARRSVQVRARAGRAGRCDPGGMGCGAAFRRYPVWRMTT